MTTEPADRRTAGVIATLALTAVTAGAVGGLVWAVVVKDSAQALTALSLIATGGLSALVALAGAKAKDGS